MVGSRLITKAARHAFAALLLALVALHLSHAYRGHEMVARKRAGAPASSPKRPRETWQERENRRPVAAVYRGPVACEGCSESAASLLRRSPSHWKVHYLGPNETHDISPKTLSHLDAFVQPGGGDDQFNDFKKVAYFSKDLRDWVQEGGIYVGICMGAFLAGGKGGPDKDETYFGLMPQGSYVSSERFEPNAEVTGDEDTIIQVVWRFQTGPERGQVQKRWAYFQDGGQVFVDKAHAPQDLEVLATYDATGDPAVVTYPFGKGYVALVGIHPEADRSWYDDWNGSNPEGVRFDLGFDILSHVFSRSQVHRKRMGLPPIATAA